MHLGNVLVTGGLGFIGSHFVRTLLNEENSVLNSLTNLDYVGYGADKRNLIDANTSQKYDFVKGDINDVDSLHFKHEIDTVVNFAAETHVDRSITNPELFVHSNVNGVAKLLEFCRKRNITTFIQVSTDEVYGDASSSKAFSEDATLRPNSPYAASKASADLLVRSYIKTYGLRAMVTRSCNNFGPNQFPEKFLPKAIIRSLKRMPIPVYGDGMQEREWLYVQDNIRAILRVIEKGRAGEIYNISSSKRVSNLQMMNHLSEVLREYGVRLKMQNVGDRPGGDRRYAIRTTKIKSLGWKQLYPLKKALHTTVEWYIANEKWWKPIINNKILHAQPWKLGWS